LRYLKITLSSTVVSQLGGRLPEESHVRIVVAELKMVVPVTCSSCDNNNNNIMGNIWPHYYRHRKELSCCQELLISIQQGRKAYCLL
jgi:hypothetical protein